jgi:hypothetical protein
MYQKPIPGTTMRTNPKNLTLFRNFQKAQTCDPSVTFQTHQRESAFAWQKKKKKTFPKQ